MKKLSIFIFIINFITLISQTAEAHVKWFARNQEFKIIYYADLNCFAFWFLILLSMVTLSFLVFADHFLEKKLWSKKIADYLESFSDQTTVILRVFTGAALMLSWQADAMIAPELKIPSSGAGWWQFMLALLLLTAKTTPIAGLGMIALYVYGVLTFGLFHMLDYLVYPAIGYFLVVAATESKKIAQSRIPALYVGLGFSLCWVALEKLFFPTWGLDVLRQQPGLAMGLPHNFFLMACVFIEMSLGYLLIIGVLQRPLALTITLVFFTTSAFFGKTEIIGHTLLHGALIVFVVMGPGNYYPAPIQFHNKLGLRAIFAAVNFVLLNGIMGICFYLMAVK